LSVGGAQAVNVSALTANNIVIGAGTIATLTDVAAAKTIIVRNGVTAGNLVATGSLGFTTLNLSLTGTTTAATLGTVNLTGQAAINIASAGLGSTQPANVFGAITNSANAGFTITGSQGVTFASFSGAQLINASALTGALTITATGNGGASSVTGGTAADTIITGTQADTIIGGAGTDTINVGATVLANNGGRIAGGLGADTIAYAAISAAGINTSTLAATAAESFATASQFDIITFADAGAGLNRTVTTATGVNGGSINSATTATVGTTVLPVGSYLVVNNNGSLAATFQSSQLYQDSNSNGLLDATDWSLQVSPTTNDTLAYTLVGGQIAIALVGV